MMKKLVYLLAAVSLLSLASCSKVNGSSSSFLPGTAWEDSNGNTVTFTDKTITMNNSTSTYSITAAAPGTAVYFNIDDLKVGETVYVSGSAYEGQKILVLVKYGGTGMSQFQKK